MADRPARRINTVTSRIVFKAFVEQGHIYAHGLAKVTGLSDSTVATIFARFEEDELIHPVEIASAADDPPGPPRHYYELTDAGRAAAEAALTRSLTTGFGSL